MKLKLLQILITVGLIGCMSPQKSLEKKNYDRAFKITLNKLKKEKATLENKEILLIALNEIIKQKTIEINKLKNSGTLENALRLVQNLQVKINAADPYLLKQISDQKNKFHKEEQDLKLEISKNLMVDGLENLAVAEKNTDKDKAQKAYYSFKKAQKYNSNINNLDSLIQKSHQLGQKIYIVEASAPFDLSYSWKINRQFDNLEGLGGKFIKVYFEPAKKIAGADCTIEIKFKSLWIKQSDAKNEQKFSKEIVTGKKTITNADCETEEVEITEEVTGKFIILEGDKRAIPNSYKSKTSNDKLMSDDDMADELIDDLYRRIKNYIL